MDLKQTKRKVVSPCFSTEGEVEVGEETRYQRNSSEDDEESKIQEFFALVESLRAVSKTVKQRRMNAQEISMAEGSKTSNINGKSPWKLCFELEDFCNTDIVVFGKGNSCKEKNTASIHSIPTTFAHIPNEDGNTHRQAVVKSSERFNLNEDAKPED